MVSVEQALSCINEVKCISEEVEVLVSSEITGCILSKEVYATNNLPLFSQSAIDGYAVCFGTESHFKILNDEIKAGDTKEFSLKKGEAIRIFTGAAVPYNTDAVVMQEKVKIKKNILYVDEQLKKEQNIRHKGEEIQVNQKIFSSGGKITPATVGLLASLGISKVKIYRKPTMAVIVTGNELLSLNEKLTYGKIYDSNSYTLGSFLLEQKIEVIQYYYVKDHLEETQKTISETLRKHDIILITGGISVGDYDFVKKSLEENGVEEIFYKVKQKPGKPLFFGKKENAFVFGLPGNPAAALTCAYVYVLPLINRFKGEKEIHLKRAKGVALNHYEKKNDRAQFLKAVFRNNQVQILQGQGSGMMHSFAKCNALVFMPESKTEIQEKEEIDDVLLLF